MKKWQKLGVSLFIVTLASLQLVAISGPYDDWPFASNSMFAYYRTSDEPVYDIVVLLEDETGDIRRLDPVSDLGLINVDPFRRLLFSRWYGSTDPAFPQGKHPGDTPEAFAARLTDFCEQVIAVMQRRGEVPAAIQITLQTLVRLDDGWVMREERQIGRYEVAEAQFVLNPIG